MWWEHICRFFIFCIKFISLQATLWLPNPLTALAWFAITPLLQVQQKLIISATQPAVHFWRYGLAWNADEKGYIEKTAFSARFLPLPVMQFVENVNRKDLCKSEIPPFIYFCKSLYWIGLQIGLSLYILIQLLLAVQLLCPSEFVNGNAIPLTIQ